MIVAGIGCRRGASVADVLSAIDAALSETELGAEALALIAAPAEKGGEEGIVAAAAQLGRPLVLVPPEKLKAAGARTLTRSERVVALFGVPSVAEASALAAAGDASVLLVGRHIAGGATCALATSAGQRA
ncbi:MAG: cobalamin biosynthesis protein [Rhizobiales bacterium]|nr:cobalamin biosynthesis protein [Hyphomicrobiales bacterium]